MAYNYSYPMNYYPMQPNAFQGVGSVGNIAPNAQNSSIIWVSGEAGAKAYMVAPNTTVQLWDSEQNIIYIKSADASGMPSIKILDYTIRDNTPKTPNLAVNSDFVTKDELQAVVNELNALKAKFKPRKDRNESIISADDRQSK